MKTNIPEHFAVIFPIFFAALWVVMSVILARMSGWYPLARAFPDRLEAPLLRLRFQSGAMGSSVNMNGILTLDVCPSGLRIGILRIFGLFSKPFFVPWEEIRVARGKRWFRPVVLLEFGEPEIGELLIRPRTAERLALAAGKHWPEATIPPPESSGTVARRALTDWVVLTAFAVAVLWVLSTAFGQFTPSFSLILLLPPVVLGIAAVVHYIRNRS